MKTASIFEELEGRTIDGKFALLERLSGSEECGVFLTLRLGGQRALIKLVRAEGAQAEACLAQWEAAKALAHPHLIRIFDSGRSGLDIAPLVYVVTENADRALSAILRERPLDPLETRDTFGPVLDALSYLHATGIVHGNIMPSNALRVGETTKLSADEFLLVPGVARRAHKGSAYDAPEVASGEFKPAADVWSIGMMLCEVLTGQFPHLSAESGLVIPESMPKSFAAIAKDCLRFDPDHRCTLSDIIPRLAPGLSLPPEFFSMPSQAAPPSTPPSREVPTSSFTPEELKIVDSLKTLPAPPPAQKISPPLESDHDLNLAPPRWRQDQPEPNPIKRFGPEPSSRATPRPVPPPSPASPASPASPPQPSARWQSKWESDTSTPLPELFSHYEEKEPRRFRVAPFLLGAFILLGGLVAFLVYDGKIDLAGLEELARQKYAALTHSDTPPPPAPAQSETARAGDAEPNAATDATSDQSQPAALPPPPQSAPSQAPATDASQPVSSATQPSVAAPAPVPAAVPSTAAAPAHTEPASPEPAHTEPALPANSEGAVAHQVMPSVSRAALESMHGPVRVVVRAEVNRQGDVTGVDYVSPGEGNYFARVSRRAAEQWKFQPPRAHGRSEDSAWTLHFYFTGSDVDVTAVREEQ